MSQFYVPDEEAAKRCHQSRTERASITVSGVDSIDGNVKLYTGVVQSVEDHGEESARSRRWRVTIEDSKSVR